MKQGNYEQKRLLLRFRNEYVKRPRSYEAKIRALIKYSKIVISYKNQRSLSERRNQFNKNKGNLLKLWIGKNKNCFVCRAPSEIRHHIIQLKYGGLNSRKNLVALCTSCHAEIHPHLKEQEIEKSDSLYEFMKTEGLAQ